MDSSQTRSPEAIAIVGMAGRFPGARNVEEFWDNIRRGVESIRRLTDGELRAAGVSDAVRADPRFVNAGAVMDGADMFDAPFFGIRRRDAEIMDPQHRVFLECAWEAIESAGYDPQRFDGPIGLFGGVGQNAYYTHNLLRRPDVLAPFEHYAITIASEAEYALTRTAFKLNLTGPVMSVNTACSTSGVAVHLACQSLLWGECDMALAGGVRLKIPLTAGYVYQEDGILSPDGRCRAFDAEARGTVAASGAAMIVLKRLSDALRDGDSISAVIRATAINNDGSSKAGFTAPSVDGQARVIAEALALAGVDARTIGYIETHGTGTALGDPIEIAALTRAFQEFTADTGFCAIGALKPNIGHMDVGAGIAGIIKAAGVLQSKEFPPAVNFDQPNPQIPFERTPFFVTRDRTPWPQPAGPRRAGVSSFGLGGTNAHIILEEAPVPPPPGPSRPQQLILLSSRTEAAIDLASANLADHLRHHPGLNLPDAAYTLQTGRRRFSHRRMIVCDDSAEAVRLLSGAARGAVTRQSDVQSARVVFMFPGGGAQYAGMGSGLYEQEPEFRRAIDQCAGLLKARLGVDPGVMSYLGNSDADSRDMENPALALPALFAVEYALARLWMSWGIRPELMAGHSMGEYTAACLAGVISLEDALALVALRGRLFETLPPGAMLAVPWPEHHARAWLPHGLSIAAVNTPTQCVIAGPVDLIDAAEREFEARGIDARRLHISVAAHSSMIEPILEEFSRFVSGVRLNPPQLPYVSNLTGRRIRDGEATDPAYWVRHLRETVRFSDGLSEVLAEPDRILLEVGPGQTLIGCARQHPSCRDSHTTVPSLRHPLESTPDNAFILTSLGQLWLAGADIDWAGFYETETRRRVPLPAYPFERERYWIEPTAYVGTPEVAIVQRDIPPKPDDAPARQVRIASTLKKLIQHLSGREIEGAQMDTRFLELGFDSLFLTQVNTAIRKEFGVRMTLRHLFGETPTLAAVAEYLDKALPPEALAPEAPTHALPLTPPVVPEARSGSGTLERIIAQQLEVMSRQLELLRGTPSVATSIEVQESRTPAPTVERKGLGPWKPVDKAPVEELTQRQRTHLDGLIERFTKRTRESKRLTQQNRSKLADPRTVAGFRLPWKELVYPIVATRASGSRLWDVDGNEWLDTTMGFGVILFGHSPAFLIEALEAQLRASIAIGPQTELAGKAAELLSELTGMERVAFCNTGSEAVLAAIRMARTVTGRDKIAVFSDDYHGMFDEVVVKGVPVAGGRRPTPVAPGIPASAVSNVLVLDYGDPKSLDVIKQHRGELAAVLVEPVQARHIDHHPVEFVKALRQCTEEFGIALVFDEMITGFRVHPGGAQAWYGVKADLATYGKVIGGGMPIGVVAGRAEYLDALDGGMWSFGDDSVPEAGMTWFAGTFVRHPLAMAAAYATLKQLKAGGPAIQEGLNASAARFAAGLNAHFDRNSIPIRIRQFSSMFGIEFSDRQEFLPLLFHHLRDRGIHCHEGRLQFLTTAHSPEDLDFLSRAIRDSVADMQAGGFLPESSAPLAEPGAALALPLTPGQEEIWLASQMKDEASLAFNVSTSIDLAGPLNLDALRKAIDELAARHDALRTTIAPDGLTQSIQSACPIVLRVIDVSQRDEPARQAALDELRDGELTTPFNLAAGPLARFTVVRLEPAHHHLIVTFHHIVCDGWSVGVLLQDLGKLYSNHVRPASATLSPPMQFSEYVTWQHERLRGEEGRDAERFWLKQFPEGVRALDLAPGNAPGATRSYAAGGTEIQLSADVHSGLRRAAVQGGVTPFALLLAGYATLLGRVSGQNQMTVGVELAGQPLAGNANLAGHCVNLIPLPVRIRDDHTLGSLSQSVQSDLIEAREHAVYSFGSLLPKLKIQRDRNRTPLVSATITLEAAGDPVPFDGLSVTVTPNQRRYCNFDLEFYVRESASGLTVRVDYNAQRFAPETVQQWLAEYGTILRSAADRTDFRVLVQDRPPVNRQSAPSRIEVPVHREPRTAVERCLTDIWKDTLGLGRIGIDDDFFELGGHSALGMRVMSRIQSDLAIRLPLSYLFEAPTVATLAERIDLVRSVSAPGPSAAPEERLTEVRL